jgi:hypothetical protein
LLGALPGAGDFIGSFPGCGDFAGVFAGDAAGCFAGVLDIGSLPGLPPGPTDLRGDATFPGVAPGPTDGRGEATFDGPFAAGDAEVFSASFLPGAAAGPAGIFFGDAPAGAFFCAPPTGAFLGDGALAATAASARSIVACGIAASGPYRLTSASSSVASLPSYFCSIDGTVRALAAS